MRYLKYLFILLFYNFQINSSEITDSFQFPGGKFQKVDGLWEEIKGDDIKYFNENGRDNDWILLVDTEKKLLIKLPSKGGQAFWTYSNEKTKWKPWQIVKHEFSKVEDNFLTLCINKEEAKFHRTVTGYRISQNLTAIPLSASLTSLAKNHLRDLETFPPTSECSYHSWSDKGSWTSCCHTNNLPSRECMYRKAREITDYKDNSFELIYFEPEENPINITDKALKLWKQQSEQNDILMNRGEWKNITWRAIGIAIGKQFIILWLGAEKDTKETPGICL